MEISEILAKCDHTVLDRRATVDDITSAIDDAMEFGVASVCIPPSFVPSAVGYADGRIPITTVIGFPNGYSSTDSKVFEAREAILSGASELDAVINVGELKAKNYEYVLNEIEALREVCLGKILKIIIETCLLTDEEKLVMCELVKRGGADFIKTSTGFASGGAELDDIVLMRNALDGSVKIKASGGIKTLEAAQKFILAGADRIGASSLIKAAKQSR